MPQPDIAVWQRVPVLPAPPRVHERHAIRKADRGRDVLEPLSARLVTAYAFGPMTRYHSGLEIVDCDHVGTAIADSRRHLDEIGGTGR